MIAYRIQDQRRDLTALLDPELQFSNSMSGAEHLERRGVSGCATLPELAAYIAGSGIEAEYPVLVRIEGPQSEDTPVDAHLGEVLLLPESAETVEDDEVFFELVGDLFEMHLMEGADYQDMLEIAEEKIG